MSILTTLLNPVERYIWGAVLVAAIGFGVYEREHLIHEGEQKVEMAEAAHAKIVAAKDQQIQTAAQEAANKVSEAYEEATVLPPVPDAGLVCRTPAAAPVSNSATADTRPEDASPPAPRADDVFDPSGALLTDSRDADAQINALIDEVEILQDYIDKLRTVK